MLVFTITVATTQWANCVNIDSSRPPASTAGLLAASHASPDRPDQAHIMTRAVAAHTPVQIQNFGQAKRTLGVGCGRFGPGLLNLSRVQC